MMNNAKQGMGRVRKGAIPRDKNGSILGKKAYGAVRKLKEFQVGQSEEHKSEKKEARL